MSCWEVLGLEAAADTRSIKRQYAVLLKQHRPDEDPVGFQRLRDAYEQALEWSRFDTRTEVEQPVQVECVQTAPDHSPARAHHDRARGLVDDATLDDLASRYQQALVDGCAEAFEELLVERCLTDMTLAQWAVTHLHWLSPWQRDVPPRLPDHRLAELLRRLYSHHGLTLLDLLDQQQPDAFEAALADLNQQEWLKPFERHERLNGSLPRLLLTSRFWSEELFERLCAQQDWNDRDLENRCPEPEWSQLNERNERERFAAHKRHLAGLDSRDSVCRAARLLFGDMPDEQRQRFARRFGEADWNACRTLSETLLTQYPVLCAEMPGGDPYFWRDWERVSRPWPMLVALLGMAAGWAIHDLQTTDHTPMQTLAIAPTWAFVIAIPTLILLIIWRPATDGYTEIDDWLAPRVAPWLSFRRPTPLVIREILPCWVLGLLIWIILGNYALIGYVLSLNAIGLAQRVLGQTSVRAFIGRRFSGHSSRRLWTISLAAVVLLMVAGLVYDNNHRIHRDEGLQPFMMSRCSGLKANPSGCAP